MTDKTNILIVRVRVQNKLAMSAILLQYFLLKMTKNLMASNPETVLIITVVSNILK